jgi:hypothetical protein
MKLKGFILTLIVSTAVCFSAPARAQSTPVIWNYEGTLNYVIDDDPTYNLQMWNDDVAPGATFSGQIKFMPGLTDQNWNPGYGVYGPLTDFTVMIDHQYLQGPIYPSNSFIRTYDNIDSSFEDGVHVINQQTDAYQIYLTLTSTRDDLWNTEAVPDAFPADNQMHLFDAQNTFSMKFTDSDSYDYSQMQGTITSISVADTNPVPEPLTALLFGTGLLGLAGTRRFRR